MILAERRKSRVAAIWTTPDQDLKDRKVRSANVTIQN